MTYTLTLTAIAAANVLAVMSPGPAFLLVSRAAAARSRGHGVATGLGVAAAATLWAVAAAFGVSLLMTRLTTLYGTLQLLGGIYLIWLGLRAWRPSPQAEDTPDAPLPGPPTRLSRAALTGFLLSLTNPKIMIFYGSIFVTLLPVDTPLWVRLAALAIVAVQESLWYALVSCVLSHHRVRAGYQRIRHRLDQVLGAVFIAFGARVVALARL